MKSTLKPALLAGMLALSACATEIPWDGGMSSIQPGMSRREVEAAFGAPTRSFVDTDGYMVWVYERTDAPLGATTSLTDVTVRFAADRVMNYSHSQSTTTTTTTVNP